MMPPTVLPDSLKALEDDAYEAEGEPVREYRDYAHLGPAVYERPYRACVLREWPPGTDFRPDNLAVRD